MSVPYLEIVSDDAHALMTLCERVHDLSFGLPDADLGQARVATQAARAAHPSVASTSK
jgi:hypothetical protein